MKRRYAIPLGTIFFLVLSMGVEVLAQQKNCSDILDQQGQVPYLQCLFSNDDDAIKGQVAAYKKAVETQKQAFRTYFESLRNEEEYTWKNSDLAIDWQIQERNRRLNEQLGSDIDQEMEREAVSRLNSIRGLSYTRHKNKIDQLKKSEEDTLKRLDYSIIDYELQLRGGN